MGMINRRTVMAGLLAGAGTLVVSRGACAAQVADGDAITPEAFGARGDGVTNDSAAFAALAAHVNRLGGGTVVLRAATYIVGIQTQARAGGPFAYEAAPLLNFVGCSRPLVIRGNGATLRSAPGLRFGTFNRGTGRPTRHTLPFYGEGERASPYTAMISVRNCRGQIEISDLELDGNLRRLHIGGPWGDVGYQIAAYGLALYDNPGTELIRNVYTHHHAVDGLLIDGVDAARRTRSRIERLRSEHNARQGCSIVGGRGYDFIDCRFAHTGRSGLVSPPGAGVDIEAENKQVRDLTFTNCRFEDNMGPSLLADSGDSARIRFSRCTFVGTAKWSAWPNKPYMSFDGCTFVGPIAQAHGSRDNPEEAAQFVGCTFRDDPALSPTREIYFGDHQNRPIANLPSNPNVRFSRCTFQLTHDSTLPWSVDVIYADCVMSQRSPLESWPRGFYQGRNRITGRATLSGSVNTGELILNGQTLPRGRFG